MTFIKWAGGKSQLLPQLSDMFPNFKNIKGYVEPFIGGGSVFFYLERQGHLKDIPKYISDINSSLITTYKTVRDNLNDLIPHLILYQNDHNENLYYNIRDNFHKKTNPLLISSQFIYLNKTCFNGMWSVNAKGVNNTSIGHKEKVKIFDPENLRICSKSLQNTIIETKSYEKIIDICKKDYFVYLDPPYDSIGENKNSSFVNYTPDKFQIKRNYLLDTFRKLDKLGCKVMMSNSLTPWIVSQFKDYYINTVKAKRIIAGDPEKRTPVDEVVITNYKPTKKQFSLEDY